VPGLKINGNLPPLPHRLNGVYKDNFIFTLNFFLFNFLKWKKCRPLLTKMLNSHR